MAKTKIIALKDLKHNDGTISFKKGEVYEVNKKLYNKASLIDVNTINEQGENHIISSWWRHFRILKK